jgi:hypothetical protein
VRRTSSPRAWRSAGAIADGFVKNGCGGCPSTRISSVRPYSRRSGGHLPHAAHDVSGQPVQRHRHRNVPAGLPNEPTTCTTGRRATCASSPARQLVARGRAVLEAARAVAARAGVRHARLQFGTVDALSYKKPEVARMQATQVPRLAASCNCDISTRFRPEPARADRDPAGGAGAPPRTSMTTRTRGTTTRSVRPGTTS